MKRDEKEAEKALTKVHQLAGYQVQPAQPKFVTIGPGRIISIACDLFETFDHIAINRDEVRLMQVTTGKNPETIYRRKRKIQKFEHPGAPVVSLLVRATKEQDPENKRGKRWRFVYDLWAPPGTEKGGEKGKWIDGVITDSITLSAVRG